MTACLFAGLDLVVGDGDVWVWSVRTGPGKSTLLRMLAGLTLQPSAGDVMRSPASAASGYLRQEATRSPVRR